MWNSKTFVYKGQVFFYAADSQIVFLTDIKYADAEEITEADLDETVVKAII